MERKFWSSKKVYLFLHKTLHSSMTGHKEQAELQISKCDWDGLNRMLHALSNSELRRMEHTMRVEILPQLNNDSFWETLLHLIQFKRQAFIAGVTAAEHLANDDTLDFTCQHVKMLTTFLKGSDATVKICNMLMPLLKNERQVDEMFDSFRINDELTKIAVMLKVNSVLSYYCIFKQLKIMHNCREIGYRCCIAMMKRNDDRSWNMASILQCYFGIDELKSKLALNIESYELSHLDKNYNTFVHFLEGKRPKIN